MTYYVRRQLKAIALFQNLKRAAKEATNDAAASAGSEDSTTDDLIDLAFELSGNDTQDDAALEELKRCCSGRQDAFANAVVTLESTHSPNESFETNRAWRLLTAGSKGTPVKPPSESERREIAEFEAFAKLDIQGAFRRLVELEPQLREIEIEAKENRKQKLKDRNEGTIHTFGQVEDLISTLIGPNSGQASQLLSSKLAFNMATLHIDEIAGLLLD
jgi:hypothetical protein